MKPHGSRSLASAVKQLHVQDHGKNDVWEKIACCVCLGHRTPLTPHLNLSSFVTLASRDTYGAIVRLHTRYTGPMQRGQHAKPDSPRNVRINWGFAGASVLQLLLAEFDTRGFGCLSVVAKRTL